MDEVKTLAETYKDNEIHNIVSRLMQVADAVELGRMTPAQQVHAASTMRAAFRRIMTLTEATNEL